MHLTKIKCIIPRTFCNADMLARGKGARHGTSRRATSKLSLRIDGEIQGPKYLNFALALIKPVAPGTALSVPRNERHSA